MYKNTAIIIGNLTRDPELKSLPNGTKVANFSVATNRTWKNKEGQKMEDVEFHNIVVFGRQAETSAQYLKKGSRVLVEGRLQTSSWEDTATGKKMYKTEIVAENVQFGSRPNNEPHQQSHAEATGIADKIEYPEEDIDVDSIPF
jgi:single-strand DNA-binding protein